MSRATLASERGAVLIQTAVTAMVMIGFGTFVADYGVLWIARHQAQNAADAGAMAGAIARAYDDFDDPPAAGGVADLNASQIAGANPVWGAPSAPVTSFTCPADIVAVDPNSRCVRVDAHRDGENGSTALPTFFGPIFGITSQGVRATATARVHVANATNCLRPWAIPDKWTEGAAGPQFSKYGAGGALLVPHDDYTPPDATGPGSGMRFATSNAALGDLGLFVPTTLYTAITDQILTGWIVPLDPPGSDYASSRDACNGQPVAVGDQIPISATIPIPFDFHNLYLADALASWNGRAIEHSCAPFSCFSPSALSPRLVAIAVFDVDIFQYRQARGNWSDCPPLSASCLPCPGGPLAPCVSIVNIVGFFIEDFMGSSGHLTSYPGLIPTDAPKLSAASSFLKAITLVR